MGKRYVAHSDMCGCRRCALQWEKENPQPVYDEIDDPDHEEEDYDDFDALLDEGE